MVQLENTWLLRDSRGGRIHNLNLLDAAARCGQNGERRGQRERWTSPMAANTRCQDIVGA
jgi:hypothetical protein